MKKPWKEFSEIPLNDWFVALRPNGELGIYYQRITDVRIEPGCDTQVGFNGSWWDISKLLGPYKHMKNIGDEPLDCGVE